jgi:hypothetical protein
LFNKQFAGLQLKVQEDSRPFNGKVKISSSVTGMSQLFRNCVPFSLFIYCSLIALFLASVLLQFSPLPLGLSLNNSASSIVLFNRSAEGDTSGV